jgi:multidrug efflux pump subunit AcrA (membrane-fusion protein)
MNVRLRFIFLMVLIGLVVGNWESIMNYYDRWRRPAEAPDMVGAQDVEYYCGMHPNIVKGEPGNCPICGMPLVKRAKTAKVPLAAGVLGQVQLTPLKMNMGRIGTTPIEYRLLARETRTVGIIDYDETRRATITARVKGRLDKLMVNFTGQKVKQGDPLALIYSPDLLVAQEELLAASKAQAEQKSPGPAGDMNQSLVESAKKKLLLWGLSQQQVEDIIKRGKADTHVTISSPIAGIVTERKALQGKYVMEGEELYTVADLSSVWLQANVFESDIEGIQPGTAVEVTGTAYPNEVFAGRITFVAYSVEASTRTIAARVEVANPDEKLKPGMYVAAVIRLPMGKVTEVSETGPSASQPASAPASHTVPTGGLAKAYLAVVESFVQDKPSPAAIQSLAKEADALSAHLLPAAALAAKVRELEGKGLDAQCESLKAVSDATIKLLQQAPPKMELFIAYCPMVKANWITAGKEIQNPYSKDMRTCGSISGPLEPAGVREDAHFVVGYYCPIYPDRLFDKAEQCPIDKFPLKRARVEKVLAVPESAIIDTGTRKVAYRQSVPGTFEMIEVQLGPRAGEFYPVVAGLKEGDQVATAGAFLVDAENRLNPAASAQYFGASGGPQSG